MEHLLDLARRVADQARPDEQVEAIVGRSRTTTVRAHGASVESLTAAETMGIGIRVVRDLRQGFAHAGSLDPEVVAATLADARDNARFSEPDEHAGLAEPDGVAPPTFELWDEAVVRCTEDAKVALALDLEARVRDLDPRITGVRSATYADAAGEAAVATSTGIAVAGAATRCHLSVVALAAAGDETTTGVGVAVGRDPEAVSVEQAAADAVARATGSLGATKPSSARRTVVFEPRTAATLLGIVGGCLTGERVLKGRSPFADRMGEAIAACALTLVDDPTDDRSPGADHHDGEGLATRRNVLLDRGVLSSFLHNSTTARRAGTVSTASAVRGIRSTPGVGCQVLAVQPGDRSPDELIAEVDDGVLITSLVGVHSGVNAVSGDVSVGAEGRCIRNGAVAEPWREFTLGSTLQRLLGEVRAVGSDLEWQPGGTGAATLVIDGVTVSGL